MVALILYIDHNTCYTKIVFLHGQENKCLRIGSEYYVADQANKSTEQATVKDAMSSSSQESYILN